MRRNTVADLPVRVYDGRVVDTPSARTKEDGTVTITAPRKPATRAPKTARKPAPGSTVATITHNEEAPPHMTDTIEAPAETAAEGTLSTDLAVVEPEEAIETVDPDVLLTKEQALELTAEINSGVENIELLLKRAFDEQAWRALDCKDWDDYAEKHIHTAVLAIPRQKRKEVVISLKAAGWSYPMIEKGTGIPAATAHRDASQSGKPAGKTTKSQDGKTYPSTTKRKVTDKKPAAKAKPPTSKTDFMVQRPSENVSEFTGDMVGFGTTNLGAAALNHQVHWYVDGESRLLAPEVARKFAACLLAAAEAAEAK